jgi:hypothetical protein
MTVNITRNIQVILTIFIVNIRAGKKCYFIFVTNELRFIKKTTFLSIPLL